MIPRHPYQIVILAFCLVFLILTSVSRGWTNSALATHPANPNMTKVFCYADSATPAFYFSRIFDVTLYAKTKISTLPLGNAFFTYLVEEYDYKSSSHYASGCTLFETLSRAEAARQKLIADAQRANKQVVEVNWNPGPIVEKPQGDESVTIGPRVPPPTHIFCALGNADTMYFSAVFDTVGPPNIQAWNNAYKDFLSKTYGFEAEVEPTCTALNTMREAERVLSARIGGVRYNRHKAVETGWKFGSSIVASTRPRPKPTPKPDDDPEPVTQRPAPAPPLADIRDFATKEVPQVLAYCQNDRMVAGAFNCYCIQRALYNYRMEHAKDLGPPEPFQSLFAKDKLDCSGCIAPFVLAWATSRAQSASLPLPVAQCVAKRFDTALRAKPYPSHVKELFNAAIAACK
jgi:hypothetical protein